MSPAQRYEKMISAPLAGMFCVLAIFLGLNLQLSKRKWKIILFTMSCVFAVAGFILYVLGLTLHMHVLQGSAWICCCCIMFIVSLFTAYYLNVHDKQGDCSISYLFFVWIYECIAFVIILQFILNSFIDCHSNGSNPNMTMIEQD
uniref:Protein lifeguard 2 n=2 Tax=Schistosoma mansoni TaxID=6183 RepID=A0A5K4FAJ7_SCHMA